MINWVIIAILIFIVISLLKMKHFGHRTLVVIIIIMFLFLYFTGSKVVDQSGANLKSFDGVITAGRVYFSWLGSALSNLKTISGDAVHLNWGGNVSSGG